MELKEYLSFWNSISKSVSCSLLHALSLLTAIYRQEQQEQQERIIRNKIQRDQLMLPRQEHTFFFMY